MLGSVIVNTVNRQSTNQISSTTAIYDDYKSLTSFRERKISPIFNSIMMNLDFPVFLLYFRLFYMLWQLAAVAFGLASPEIWDLEIELNRYLLISIDFGSHNKGSNKIMPYIIVGLVLGAIPILSFIFYPIFHNHLKKCQNLIFHALHFNYYIVLPIISPFICYVLGKLIIFINEEPNVKIILLFVSLLIMALITIGSYIYAILARDYSIILSHDPYLSWDARIPILIHIKLCLAAFMQPFVQIINRWVLILILLCQVCADSVLIYFMLFFPFHCYYVNHILISFHCFFVISSIIAIIQYFTQAITSEIAFLVSISFLIISLLVSCAFFKTKKEKIVGHLSENNSDRLDSVTYETIRHEHFEAIRFNSLNEVLAYMRIGVLCHCKLIVDESFQKYILENYSNENIIYAISKIAGLFPCQLQFCTYCLNQMDKAKKMHFGQYFLCYQMRRIVLLRQSSNSIEATNIYNVLDKQSEAAISELRTFWREIYETKGQISFSPLNYLRIQSTNCNFAFLDAVENYPSSINILQTYMKFQIENFGDYQGSIKTVSKLVQIEQGKSVINDVAFISLCRLHPNYLYDEIFDERGNMNNDRSISNKSSMLSSTDFTNNSSFNENDALRSFSIFNHPKLRVSLQRRLAKVSFSSTKSTYALAIYQFIYLIVLYMLLLFLVPLGPYNSKIIYTLSHDLALITNLMQYNIFNTASNLMRAGGSDYTQTVFDRLNIPIDSIPKVPSIFYEQELSIHQTSIEIDQIYLKIVHELDYFRFVEQHKMFSNPEIRYTKITATGFVSPYNLSLRTYIQNLVEMVTKIVDEKITNPIMFQSDSMEIIRNSIEMTETVINMQDSILQVGLEHTVYFKNLLYVLLGVIDGSFTLIYIIASILNFFWIYKDMKSVSDMLKSIKHDDIEESLSPICLKSNDKKITCSNTRPANETNYRLQLYIVSVVFAIIVSNGLFVASVMIYLDQMKTEDSIYQWFNYNSNRCISCVGAAIAFIGLRINIVDNLTASKFFRFFFATAYDNNNNLIRSVTRENTNFNRYFVGSQTNGEKIKNWADLVNSWSPSQRFTEVLNTLRELMMTNDSAAIDFGVHEAFFFFNSYFFQDFESLQNEITGFADSFYSEVETSLLWFSFFGLFVTFICFALELSFAVSLSNSTKAISQLILALPPLSVMKNPKIMEMVLGKEDNDVHLSESEIIVDNFSHPLIIIDRNLVVQNVNNSIQNMLEFMPNEILGQRINYIIPDANEEINFNLLDDSDGKIISNIRTKCKTSNGEQIKVSIDIFALVDIYVLVLSDISRNKRSRKKLKLKKQRSKLILQNLLPIETFNYLNGSSTKSFYRSDHATIIYIEINGFNESVHTLSPNQMMINMNQLFDKFMEIKDGYPDIKPIKIEESRLICCCGLFGDHEISPEEQARQSVNFCLDLLDSLDEITL